MEGKVRAFRSTGMAARRYAGFVEKKTARILARLKNDRGLSDGEKILWARSLAATPEQRWQFNLAALKFYNSFPRSKKSAFRS